MFSVFLSSPAKTSYQSYFPSSHEEGSSVLEDCLLQENRCLCRQKWDNEELQSKLMGPKRFCGAAGATFPPLQQLQQRAGNPRDALSWQAPRCSAGCSVPLVWMREALASDALLTLFKLPQSDEKGGALRGLRFIQCNSNCSGRRLW